MMRLPEFRLMLAACVLGGLRPLTSAHSISLIEGEALVHSDKIELKVAVRPEDILFSAGEDESSWPIASTNRCS